MYIQYGRMLDQNDLLALSSAVISGTLKVSSTRLLQVIWSTFHTPFSPSTYILKIDGMILKICAWPQLEQDTPKERLSCTCGRRLGAIGNMSIVGVGVSNRA